MKILMALSIAAAALFTGATASVAADCRDGYHYDEDAGKCVRDRGSHG